MKYIYFIFGTLEVTKEVSRNPRIQFKTSLRARTAKSCCKTIPLRRDLTYIALAPAARPPHSDFRVSRMKVQDLNTSIPHSDVFIGKRVSSCRPAEREVRERGEKGREGGREGRKEKRGREKEREREREERKREKERERRERERGRTIVRGRERGKRGKKRGKRVREREIEREREGWRERMRNQLCEKIPSS
jgi:hypothetical protein